LKEINRFPLGDFLRTKFVCLLALAAIFLAGCPKANQDIDAGRKAEAVQDYDTALVQYEHALRTDPTNAEYKLSVTRMRFEDGQYHLEQGQKALDKGDLQTALAEFQKAEAVDPSNEAADQQLKKTIDLITAKGAAQSSALVNPTPDADDELLAAPPELKPLSRTPIDIKNMTNSSKAVFETIAKLAGLSVIFDPSFTARQITADLPNVTLEQALDAVALESGSFWKPLSSNIIFVAPDNPQKRRDVEDEEVQPFYLSNTLTQQDITEIVTGLRQLFDMRRVVQVNGQNAIVIRDTPDRLALAAKFIRDVDKAKPEVLIHVQVLSANVDRLRDLGILPGQSVSVAFSPRSALQPTTTTSSSTTSTTSIPQVTLNNLHKLTTSDWSITLPGAQANAILTDNNTQIIQNPEVRITDGQKATMQIGQRIPVATGSFQAGVGVGTTAVNPLVNTQFQYIPVGVNIEVTPRVHPEGNVSMHMSVEISAVATTSNIGGINQPVISQTKEEGDVDLKDGEASILGGLIEQDVIKNLNGIPGGAQIPIFRYLVSDNSHEVKNNEVLIVITPHVIRFPSITADNLRSIAAGTDTNARVYRSDANAAATPGQQAPIMAPAAMPPANSPTAAPDAAPAAQLHFDPATVTLKSGDATTIGVSVANVSDLYSIPLLIHYNPAVVRVEEVRDGGFLSGGNQQIAIVQRIDEQRGEVVVSATRQPNTPGVNGSGTVVGIVVRGVAPGNANLQILQVNARDSQQKLIPMVSGVATIQVQ
jgi:general secretion pathway protein D